MNQNNNIFFQHVRDLLSAVVMNSIEKKHIDSSSFIINYLNLVVADPYSFIYSSLYNELSSHVIDNVGQINTLKYNYIRNSKERYRKKQGEENNPDQSRPNNSISHDNECMDTFGTDSNLMNYIVKANIENEVCKEESSDSKNSISSGKFGSDVRIEENKVYDDVPNISSININHNSNVNNVDSSSILNVGRVKEGKKASPLKSMFARMKSSINEGGLGVQKDYRSPNTSPHIQNKALLMNDTGMIMANGNFKSVHDSIHNQNMNNEKEKEKDKTLNSYNSNKCLISDNLANNSRIHNFLTKNPNNTMPINQKDFQILKDMNSKQNNTKLNQNNTYFMSKHPAIIEEVQNEHYSKSNATSLERTLDINVVRYQDDDELNNSMSNTAKITVNFMNKTEFRKTEQDELHDMSIASADLSRIEMKSDEDEGTKKRPSVMNGIGKIDKMKGFQVNVDYNAKAEEIEQKVTEHNKYGMGMSNNNKIEQKASFDSNTSEDTRNSENNINTMTDSLGSNLVEKENCKDMKLKEEVKDKPNANPLLNATYNQRNPYIGMGGIKSDMISAFKKRSTQNLSKAIEKLVGKTNNVNNNNLR